MSLTKHNIEKLKEIEGLLIKLPSNVYTESKDILTGATVGQHIRHILEFFTCVEKGLEKGVISFDERVRNINIETDKNYALTVIHELINFLSGIEEDCPLILKANFSTSDMEDSNIQSSLFRELAYTLDHTVHHLAIVKIALISQTEEFGIDENFGVAPSTIRFRKKLQTH